jgi:hypothetical protein
MRVSPSTTRAPLPASRAAPPRNSSRPPGRARLAAPALVPRCTPSFREAFSWDEVFGDDQKDQEVVLQPWQVCAQRALVLLLFATLRVTPCHHHSQEERIRQELGVGRRKFNVRSSLLSPTQKKATAAR